MENICLSELSGDFYSGLQLCTGMINLFIYDKMGLFDISPYTYLLVMFERPNEVVDDNLVHFFHLTDPIDMEAC